MALRAFALDGYEGASVRKISREVGVSHTLMHHYFGSKDELWKACIDYSFGAINDELSPLLAELTQGGSVLERVHRLIVRYVELSARFPEAFQVISQEGTRGGPRLEYILKNHVRQFLILAQQLIQSAADLGILRPVPWASLFFLVFSGAPALFSLREFANGIHARPADLSEEEFVAQHAQATADMILAALTPTSPAPVG